MRHSAPFFTTIHPMVYMLCHKNIIFKNTNIYQNVESILDILLLTSMRKLWKTDFTSKKRI